MGEEENNSSVEIKSDLNVRSNSYAANNIIWIHFLRSSLYHMHVHGQTRHRNPIIQGSGIVWSLSKWVHLSHFRAILCRHVIIIIIFHISWQRAFVLLRVLRSVTVRVTFANLSLQIGKRPSSPPPTLSVRGWCHQSPFYRQIGSGFMGTHVRLWVAQDGDVHLNVWLDSKEDEGKAGNSNHYPGSLLLCKFPRI